MALCFLMRVTARKNVDLGGWTGGGELEEIRREKNLNWNILYEKNQLKTWEQDDFEHDFYYTSKLFSLRSLFLLVCEKSSADP